LEKIQVQSFVPTNSENFLPTYNSWKSEKNSNNLFGAASWQNFWKFFSRIFDRNIIQKIGRVKKYSIAVEIEDRHMVIANRHRIYSVFTAWLISTSSYL
jgi:hypothetical protein